MPNHKESEGLSIMWADHIREAAPWVHAICPEELDGNIESRGTSSFPTFPGFEEAKYGSSVSFRGKNAADADRSVPVYERPFDQKTSGEALWCILVEKGIMEQRPDIQILYSSPAQRLIKVDGEIRGVIAKQDGKEITIKAKKAVCLTSGGYEYNEKMRRAFLEGPGVAGWSFYGTPYNTGDGIEMGILAGAALCKVAKSAARIECAFPWGENYEKHKLKMGVTSSIQASGHSIVINNYGKRYGAESLITDASKPYRY